MDARRGRRGLPAAGFALWLAGGFGAGDGKLLAAAGLWTGPGDLGLYLFCLALAALAPRAFALPPFAAARHVCAELPFAVAIAPPALAILLLRTLPLQP